MRELKKLFRKIVNGIYSVRTTLGKLLYIKNEIFLDARVWKCCTEDASANHKTKTYAIMVTRDIAMH